MILSLAVLTMLTWFQRENLWTSIEKNKLRCDDQVPRRYESVPNIAPGTEISHGL